MAFLIVQQNFRSLLLLQNRYDIMKQKTEVLFMEIKTTFDPRYGEKAHQDTILAGPVLPAGLKAPFDHAWGYLDKPGEMEYHKHPKEEIYFFFKGEGFVRIDGEEFPVQPGDVVRIPVDAMHTVINRRDQELLWAAFWWPVME